MKNPLCRSLIRYDLSFAFFKSEFSQLIHNNNIKSEGEHCLHARDQINMEVFLSVHQKGNKLVYS